LRLGESDETSDEHEESVGTREIEKRV